MSKKKFHTDNKQFPEPGVPADEAWKQMHELLVKNDLTGPSKKDKRRRLLFFFILFCLFISSGTIYMFTSQQHSGKTAGSKNNNHTSTGDAASSTKNNNGDTSDKIKQAPFIDTLLHQQTSNLNNANRRSEKARQQIMLPHLSPANNNSSSINNHLSTNKPAENVQQATQTNIAADEKPSSSTIKPLDKDETEDRVEENNNADQFSLKKVNTKTQKTGKFHFGLEWNINFSTVNNSHYFDAYNGGNQYYMWLLPSAWAKMDIGKKHGIALHINPYYQEFAGKQIVHIEKPFIASIEPDVVTKLVKSRGYNLGINYEYNASRKLTITAGLNYTIQNKALYAQQEVIAFSGAIVSDSIKTAGRNDASFNYLRPAYLSWEASAKYNFKKLSIGTGVTKPITNLSSDPGFSVRPLNGKIYLQYRIK